MMRVKAVERKSERADTAYSPRVREEELSATAEREAGGGAKVRANGYGVLGVSSQCTVVSTPRLFTDY